MKSYPYTAIDDEAWKAIAFVFWRDGIDALPPGTSGDGLSRSNFCVETNKDGVEITGEMSFMSGGHDAKFFSHPICLLLNRPRFTNVGSVTAKKIIAAEIVESYFEGDTLIVALG
ncbi:MAG: hypothetical protein KDN19_20115 [Verrucomicrobiae bacterium]|nr:hypothetical protein [Verrucomicrobiae bacterium]